MPRTYQRKLGGRPYKYYSNEDLESIIKEIECKNVSAREAHRRYGIHRNVLNKKLKQRKQQLEEDVSPPERPHGGQTVLPQDVEQSFVSHIVTTASFGFPMTTLDLRVAVQSYLNKIRRRVVQFPNNLPGTDWARLFLERHQIQLTQRMSQNITRPRANVDRSVVEEFFSHLAFELGNIPSCNIWTYDEISLSDDPGSEKIIFRRDCKHPDFIKDATQATVSVMMCGNAGGDLAPVYVCYRAEELPQSWTVGGPTGTRYNRSKSGWFDGRIFEDWFEFLMLPVLKKQDGKKILIGDNLSSHFSERVLTLCQENDVRFSALPLNSTHLLQPLIAAFFKPTTVAWTKVLDTWKESPEGKKEESLPKHQFPELLKQLMDELEENKSANLEAGFRACGMWPLDPTQVLDQISDRVFLTFDDMYR